MKFNKAVDANTITVDDFTFTRLDTLSNNNIVTTSGSANVTGSLSADGKTYTIKTNDGSTVFSGRYDVKLAANTIKSTTNQGFVKYEQTLTLADTTAPGIASVKANVTSDTTADVVVTFNEQVSDAGTLNVNGKSYTSYSLASNHKTATFSSVAVATGQSYTASVVGAVDVKGNIAGTLSSTISIVADTTVPTVAISAKNTTITLKFSEELNATLPTVTVNGTTLTAVLDSSDTTDTTYTVDASSLLTSTTFLNNAVVAVSAFQDVAGNNGKTTQSSVNLTKDTTAPVLVSKELVNNQLVLKFDEAVTDTALAVDVTGVGLSFVDADGVVTPLTTTALAGTKGKDLNGNGTIDANTDEEKYVVISLAGTSQVFGSNGNLVNGQYKFSWAKGTFEDVAGNDVAAATFTLLPTTSSSLTATVNYSTTGTVSGLTLKNNQILVTYDEAMGTSALNVANYKLAGQALPAGTTAVFYADKLHVLLTLPQGSITANGTRTLTVSDVTSAVGNTLDTDTQTVQTVTLKETVLPTLSSVVVNSANQATATFSEDLVNNASVTGVTVKVNGIENTGATVTATGGKLVITTSVALTSSSAVTLVFTSTNLADANGNTVADN